jgi:hypothetical protein
VYTDEGRRRGCSDGRVEVGMHSNEGSTRRANIGGK